MRVIFLLIVFACSPVFGEVVFSYKGVIRPSQKVAPNFQYGMAGMDYWEECGSETDPTPSDGYPGCICAQATNSSNYTDPWGCFDIAEPELVDSVNRTDSYYNDSLTKPTLIKALFNPSTDDVVSECVGSGDPYSCCTGSGTGTDCSIQVKIDETQASNCQGSADPWACCVSAGESDGTCVGDDWVARDIPGMVIFDDANGEYITTCGHDWYNVSDTDHKTHCWGDLDDSGATATGPWGLVGTGTESNNSDPLSAHAQRTGWYLGEIPQDWANTNLAAGGVQTCFTGMHRAGGGDGRW